MVNVTRNNLEAVDVEFRLGAFNVITGVSGAGKSSLVEELTARHREGRLHGASSIGALVEVDQAPIGRTPRSNPATYTGLFDLIRDLYAGLPEASARGLERRHFSFNVAGGRCEVCEGAGVIDVGMHFLGSIEVPCEACGGRRFHADTLEVRHEGLTIHDVLELTVAEAARVFAGQPPLARILSTLGELGLGYLKIGQPSTTLSGGEAQRVKLAAELRRAVTSLTLYVLDEPTSGLHAVDVRVLVAALNRLVDQGHTVIVVEHHLDLIAAADWVVDLGPESGRRGGKVVVAGTPDTVAASARSHTGRALRERNRRNLSQDRPSVEPAAAGTERLPGVAAPIRFTGITTHNLKQVEVEIPSNLLVAVTGVSGSGKSSLAFDTLFAEGRNRFLESFPTYLRRFGVVSGDAAFESVSGLTAAIAIGQEVLAHNPRSTVGTLTGIDDFYRLLYSRAGTPGVPGVRGGPVRARDVCGAVRSRASR